MCEHLQEAIDLANLNTRKLAESIDMLPVPDTFKARFFELADKRGFRSGDENFRQMEEIGKTKSDMCLMLLEGKDSGLIVPYILATELETEKQRADAIVYIQEQSKKKAISEKDMWKAVAAVTKGARGLFDE